MGRPLLRQVFSKDSQATAARRKLREETGIKASTSDDASHLAWHSVFRLPKLPFDHRETIEKAKQYFKERRKRIFQEKKFS